MPTLKHLRSIFLVSTGCAALLPVCLPFLAFAYSPSISQVETRQSLEGRVADLERQMGVAKSVEEAYTLRLAAIEAQNAGGRILVLENNVSFMIRLLEVGIGGVAMQLAMQFFRLLYDSRRREEEDDRRRNEH